MYTYRFFSFVSILILGFSAFMSADCCNNECVKFKKAKSFCNLLAREIQALESASLGDTTVNSKFVIENEQVDGDITVLNGANFNDSVVINGDLIINGITFSPSALEYAYFVSTTHNQITAPGALFLFTTDVHHTAGITLNGDGSFTLATAGIYVINFSIVMVDTEAAFCLSTVPVSVSSNIANTNFACSSGDSVPDVGFTIIQTNAANTTIGVRNTLSINHATPAVGPSNVVGAVQIIKIR